MRKKVKSGRENSLFSYRKHYTDLNNLSLNVIYTWIILGVHERHEQDRADSAGLIKTNQFTIMTVKVDHRLMMRNCKKRVHDLIHQFAEWFEIRVSTKDDRFLCL